MNNIADIDELVPLEDIDVSLFPDAKCIDLLDHWYGRMREIHKAYPDRSQLPVEAQCELRHICRVQNRLYRELQYRDNRLN